jgi:phosphoserine phosphatase RsbU/P
MPSPRVLVADDQLDILQALRLLLSEAGFTPELASSPADVLTRVHSAQYDLVLMDLNYTRDTTSGREGLDLLAQLRDADPGLPVVVMTGWGNVEMAVDAMRGGARSFVQKPWDDLVLVDMLRREVDEGVATRHRDARLAREQEDARRIQQALLPSAMPEIQGCQLAARWTPAWGIGGDCYDVLSFGDSQVAISIADVIGKGLPAALLMSNLQAAVRAFATPSAEPQEVCTNVNRLLCRNIAAGKFVSFCYAVIDLAAGVVSYANAGHFPPILRQPDGRIDRLASTGMVLGVTSDWSYAREALAFPPGAQLVCFTDGLTEALSSDGEDFGEARLITIVRDPPRQSADALARTIMDEALSWAGGTFQDDATLIVAAREPDEQQR